MTGDQQAQCKPNADGSCSICADEALPGLIVSVNAREGTAEVRLPNEVATVAMDLVDDACAGDAVMVHMGFAISRVNAHAIR